MERWCGKTAVVTGASSGIGGAIAATLAANGMQVVGLDVNADVSKTTPVENGCIFRRCDLSNLEEIHDAFKWIEATYGGVDVMVNCAAFVTLGHITSVGDNPLSDEAISRSLDVNIKAVTFCSRYAVNSMKKRGIDGHVININSIAGHYIPFTDQFNVYSSTKYAVTAFTQSLAIELATFGSKIRTTSVSPGLVQTPLSGRFVPDFSAVPKLQPRDVADAVLYAVSAPPHVNISEITVQPVAELRK